MPFFKYDTAIYQQVVAGNTIKMGGRYSRITNTAEAEKDTVETGEMGIARTGGQEETIDSVEETGVVAEVMGTQQISPPPTIILQSDLPPSQLTCLLQCCCCMSWGWVRLVVFP